MKIHHPVIALSLLFICSGGYSQTDTTIAGKTIVIKVDKESAYPGGEPAWKKFMERNLNPHVPVDKGAPTGMYTVYVQFIVNTDGTLSDFRPLTTHGYGMEQEVVKMLRKSGTWDPAILEGRPVNSYRKQPVTFGVIEEGFDIDLYSIVSGRDNEISIKLKKVKFEDMDVTISRGTITPGANGKFIARVMGVGPVTIKVFNKKNKLVATANLDVIEKE
jgi:hypothetical protein